mmetsp:Transcript_38477/g.64756  ORF Transcript_38477/g.64756 Transcript_38477/m.64756 type:complete len:158 (-) Transcript_38477:175-648(-)|eukprot:CAMPEP_0198199114 /NCGR_PEP_ID=MMETSP1445-20131203/2443_1 /TAXON_ID=36898 /ORGANISM="Pyramimonas sp., Strain CCMP2087" /LENGTH=157 /DNA_ID=CAMNT_0043868855 /DNA_START=95 /DNA_END=568 /DNA_ORIENTATION=-
MASICASFQGLSLGASASSKARAPVSFSSSIRGSPVVAFTRKAAPTRAATFVVYAAQNSLKRIRTSEKARMYNKSLKSEMTTRSKKAFVEMDGLVKAGAKSEDEFKKAELLIAEAFGVIDSSIFKGVIHKNTADRKKSKLARYKTRALQELGLYTVA